MTAHPPAVAPWLTQPSRSVSVMLGTRCNLSCAYCPQSRRTPRSLAMDDLEAAVDFLLRARWGRPELVLYGGEPLLELDLVRHAVAGLRRRGARPLPVDLRLFTNGTLLDEETTRFLVEWDVHVMLSSDGISSAQDCRGVGTFEVLDRLLLRLRRHHRAFLSGRFTVKATLTSANVPHLAESFRYLLARGIRDLEVVPLVTHDPGWGPTTTEELDRQLASVVDASLTDRLENGGTAFTAFRGSAEPTPRGASPVRMCGLGRDDVLFVDVDGTIAPCAAMVPSCQSEASGLMTGVMSALAGCHIRDPDLDRRLADRQRRARSLRLGNHKEAKRSRLVPCADCEWLGTCHVCPASIATAPGNTDPDLIPEHQCAWNRLVLKHRRSYRSRLAASG